MIDGGSGGNVVSSLDTRGTPEIVGVDRGSYMSMASSTKTSALVTTFVELVHTGQIRLTGARGPDDDGLTGVLARI